MPDQGVGGGVQLHYEDRGPRQGQPVVFLHGWAASGEAFEGQAVFLSDHDYRVITLDERGCGRSSKPNAGYEVSQQSEDLRAFIEGLHLDRESPKPILVGWSIGAAIVMDYLINHQEHVAKAVLVGFTPRFTSGPPGWPYGFPPPQLRRLLAALADGKTRLPAARDFFDTTLFYTDVGRATKDWQLRIFSQATWFVDQGLRDLGRVDSRPQLPTINIPVGIFHGLQDQVAPIEAAEFAANEFPNAKPVVTFSNSGHAPFLEESQWFNEKLLAFLRDP